MRPQDGERIAVVTSHDGLDLGMLERHGYNEVTMYPCLGEPFMGALARERSAP
jgi:hypothetical protein